MSLSKYSRTSGSYGASADHPRGTFADFFLSFDLQPRQELLELARSDDGVLSLFTSSTSGRMSRAGVAPALVQPLAPLNVLTASPAMLCWIIIRLSGPFAMISIGVTIVGARSG